MIYSQGCLPIITQPTRITENSSTLIDHIYTNNTTKETKSFILFQNLTDHMPIIVSTNLKKLNQKPYMTYTRDTKNFDAESFQKDLRDNLSKIGNGCEEDGNSLMRNFINIFNDTLNNHAPLRKQTRKERKLRSKPWLTIGILISIKHKNKMFVECLKKKS